MVTLCGSPPKRGDIAKDPVQRGDLIKQAVVAGSVVFGFPGQLGMREKAEDAEAVIGA